MHVGRCRPIQNRGGTGISRIGRMPIAIPDGVTVTIAENNQVTVKGPKGTLERVLPAEMDIKQEGSEIIVTRPNDLKKMKSLHGLTRTLIHNMVVGVTAGYEKTLEVNGVGSVSYTHLQQQFPKVKVSRAQLRDLASTEDLWLMVLNSIVIRVPTALVLLRVKYSKEKECRDTWVA